MLRRSLIVSLAMHLAGVILWVEQNLWTIGWASGVAGFSAPILVEPWSEPRAAATPPPSRSGVELAPESPGQPGAPRPVAQPESGVLSLQAILEQGNEAPEYPLEARRNRWQGTVRLKFDRTRERTLDEEVEPILLESSGYPLLDRAALAAARRWRLPAGPQIWIIPVEFVLSDSATSGRKLNAGG